MNLRITKRLLLYMSGFIILSGLSACAGVKIRTLDPPPATAKLRVLFLPLSDTLPGSRSWAVPHKQYTANLTVPMNRFLGATGIYEMVPHSDVDAALLGRDSDNIDWSRTNWETARKVGRAVHADYVAIARRGYQGFFYFQMLWINLETGQDYEFVDHPGTFLQGSALEEEYRKMTFRTYREFFHKAKGDLLVSAIRKGRRLTTPPELAPPAELKPTPAPPVPVITSPSAKQKLPAAAARESTREPIAPPAKPAPKTEKIRLVVYDLEAPPAMQVAALIMTEALREELHKLGSFDLVNRDDLNRAIEEIKLQQSGLVRQEDAVKTGRWLAARQSVTGHLGSVGRIVLLQIKRTDIETLETLAVTSLKAPFGKEDELLNDLPDMARKLLWEP